MSHNKPVLPPVDPQGVEGGDQFRKGAKQITQGASQMAAAAKNRLTPVLAKTRSRLINHVDTLGGWLPFARIYAPHTVIGSALVALVAMLLPVSESIKDSFVSAKDGEAALLTVLIVLAVTSAAVHVRQVFASTLIRRITGISATLLGLLAIFDGFVNAAIVEGSIPLVLLGLAGLVLVVGGVIVFTAHHLPRDCTSDNDKPDFIDTIDF